MMKSKIENYLKLDLNPVAIIWSNDKPERALQYKKGKFGCVMHLVAQAAKGKTAVLDTDTCGCFTAAASFGFGKIEDRYPLDMDFYYAFLSCGMGEMDDELKELIVASEKQGSAPQDALRTLLEGEGFKKTKELVKEHIDSLPDIQINEKHVVMKPLKEVNYEKETPSQIVFFADPNQVSALVKLANFSTANIDMVKIYAGSACQDIGLFAYQESQEDNPKAILGLTDVYARKNLKRTIGTDKLTFTVPLKLFMTMEKDADESLLVRDTWTELLK